MMDKKKLAAEFKRCKNDPIYFISRYVKVTHPIRGLVNFDLYPFQKKIVRNIERHRFNILRKFRQAGCTTIAAAYAIWFTIFQKHKTVVIISRGDAESTELLERIKLMYDELPAFLQPGITESNKHNLKLNTNSVIRSRPSAKQSGRSLAGSLLIVDEAAFIENIDTIWAAVYPIISTGGRAFILSTVNGMGNWFYETYTQAILGENSFNPVDIKWTEHPEYSYNPDYRWLYDMMREQDPPLDILDWEEVTKSNISLKKWKQEYECEFLGTGDTFIEGSILEEMTFEANENYVIKYNNKMRVWEAPRAEFDYVIGVDVALGREGDYSAFHIINLYNGEQVGEFYSNKTPINEFAKIIAAEGNLYNNATVLVERNGIGTTLIDWLFNVLEYENLWTDDKGEFGFLVTSKTKEELLTKLEEAVRTKLIKVNSQRTVNELITFIITETGKLEADVGKHDDLVISLAITVFGVHRVLGSTPLEYSKIPMREHSKLPEMSKLKSHNFKAHNPYGVTQEDITWLMKNNTSA